MDLFKRFILEEEGVTAIEYALIAALIAVVIIGTLTTLGGAISDKFQVIADAITGAGGGS
jgi:pilus assembly protein Flp/PilA